MKSLFFIGISLIAFVNTAVAEPLMLAHVPEELYKIAPDREEGSHAMSLWEQRISSYMQFSNIKGLEGWCQTYVPGQTREQDGMWVSARMFKGFYAHFDGYTAPHKFWERDLKLLESWRAHYPHSLCAPIVTAIYWSRYAWDARGGGYADSVTPEGWRLFRERLQKGKDVLMSADELKTRNPEWAYTMLTIARGLEWPRPVRKKIFDDAVARFPNYFPLYAELAFEDTPRWGGSWRLVDSDIRGAVAKTRAEYGKELYARIYWNIFSQVNNNLQFHLFDDTLAQWPEMRQGFRDLLAHYPNSAWNLNSFAAFACQAGDMKTYHKLRRKITSDNYYSNVWPGNLSMDVCDRMKDKPRQRVPAKVIHRSAEQSVSYHTKHTYRTNWSNQI